MTYNPFSYGIRSVIDGQMRFTRSGVATYLRVKNFTEQPGLNADGTYGDFIELGVPFSPSGVASVATGFDDILIQPPPGVQPISTHNIGLFGGRLNFGSKYFNISHTFVREQMALLNLPDGKEKEVFRDRNGKGKCIGLIYDATMYNIASLQPRAVAGEFVNWQIIGNAFVEVSSQQDEDTAITLP